MHACHYSKQALKKVKMPVQNKIVAPNSSVIFLLFFGAGISDMQVKEYLMTHTHLVEDFIMTETSQEQLERWLIRKTQALQQVDVSGGDGMHWDEIIVPIAICQNSWSILTLLRC